MAKLLNLPFALLHLSTLLTLVLLVLSVGMKNKKTLHYFAVLLELSIFLWCSVSLVEQYAIKVYNYTGMFFTNCLFSVVAFVSVFVFLFGYSYAHPDSKIPCWMRLLFVVPVLCVILIWTNDYHHLYFIHYSPVNSEFEKGVVLKLHPLYSYTLIAAGLYYLIRSTIRNSGFFSKQSFLIIIGALFPFAVDVAFVAKLFTFPVYYEPISFALAMVFIMISVFRFGFLSIVPIALQTVVDHISDGYIVVNDRDEIIDFNRTFYETFREVAPVSRKMSLDSLLLALDEVSFVKREGFLEAIGESVASGRSVSFENQYSSEKIDKTFSVEITPIITHNLYKGLVVLFKDLTEQKKSFEMIRQAHVMLIEQEHLVSLGQLIGGIAHNLKTPIMSIAGGLEGLSDLVDEYEESIGDASVTEEDHREIAGEMRVWIGKMREYAAYMSDVISTVKGQAVQLTASTAGSFTVRELIRRVEILMNHELKKFGCRLNVRCEIDMDTEIRGELSSFVQVMNNLVANAIEAYGGKEGEIDFCVSMEGRMVLFEVRDYGSGIPEEVKSRLFKEMVTTKAKNGTGLGLYMSYSTITGRFGGKMWFESAQGMGTAFYILIPAA